MTAATDLDVADVAGSVGFGAYSQGQWFFGPWAPSQVHQAIAYKELTYGDLSVPRGMCSSAQTTKL